MKTGIDERHGEASVAFDFGEIDSRLGWREPGEPVAASDLSKDAAPTVEVLRWIQAAPRALPKTIKLRAMFAEFALSRWGSGNMTELAKKAGVKLKTVSVLADDFAAHFGVHVFGQRRRRRKKGTLPATKPAASRANERTSCDASQG